MRQWRRMTARRATTSPRAKGATAMQATVQRIRLRPKGGTVPARARPTTAFPAQESMATVSSR